MSPCNSLRLRLRNLVRSVFPEWTDFNVASFGNILVELYAFVGDVLAYYQDNQARESRIATATQRGETLTRQLLTYSRQQMLSPQVIDLTQRLPNIREVLSFPKTASGSDLMFDAPSEIDEKQLRELKIKLVV